MPGKDRREHISRPGTHSVVPPPGVVAILFLCLLGAAPQRLSAQQAGAGAGPETVPVPRELSPALPSTVVPSPASEGVDAAAAELLAQARQLRAAGNARDAYALYRRWLEQYPDAPEYGLILQEAAAGAPDVHLAGELYRRYGAGVKDRGLREEILVDQGRLLAAAGRAEDALELLAAPAASTRRLYLRAVLLYQQGELERCLDVLREALADRVVEAGEAGENAPAGRRDGSGQELLAEEPPSEEPPGPTPAAEPGEAAAGDEALSARIYFLMAQAYAALGRAGEAESLYLLLQKRFADTSIAPAAYLAYAELLEGLGRSGEATQVAAELKRLFPSAPEASLLGPQSRVGYAPTPSRLLPQGTSLRARGEGAAAKAAESGGETAARPRPPAAAEGSSGGTGSTAVSAAKTNAGSVDPGANGPPTDSESAASAAKTGAGSKDPPANVPATVPGDAAPGAGEPATDSESAAPERPRPKESGEGTEKAAPAPQALVQTGSYRDPENAHYMVRDLKAAGFAAEIRDATLHGKTFHRVVIGPPMSWEEAEKMMLRLKEAGFEGFLLLLD
jgi:cell division protein FtsN